MSESPERTALYRLYSTSREHGLPAFLSDLYPDYLSARRYLGTAGGCKNGGPGLRYAPWDWESEYIVTLKLDIEWGRARAPRNPSRRKRITGEERTALYRLRNAQDELLYVGISATPLQRWPQHAAEKEWWPEVANLSLEWVDSKAEALAAEAQAIRTEKPLHNIVHNKRAA